MSRTIRNIPTSMGRGFRKPKGRKAWAMRGEIRPKAIPPTDWDDIPISAYREAFHQLSH
jgi:hypothetical protein